jgi:small ligand-binding sensory domain FIST
MAVGVATHRCVGGLVVVDILIGPLMVVSEAQYAVRGFVGVALVGDV